MQLQLGTIKARQSAKPLAFRNLHKTSLRRSLHQIFQIVRVGACCWSYRHDPVI
jgi:hypothetical protein